MIVMISLSHLFQGIRVKVDKHKSLLLMFHSKPTYVDLQRFLTSSAQLTPAAGVAPQPEPSSPSDAPDPHPPVISAGMVLSVLISRQVLLEVVLGPVGEEIKIPSEHVQVWGCFIQTLRRFLQRMAKIATPHDLALGEYVESLRMARAVNTCVSHAPSAGIRVAAATVKSSRRRWMPIQPVTAARASRSKYMIFRW